VISLQGILAIALGVLLFAAVAEGYLLKKSYEDNGVIRQQVQTATQANKEITNAATARAKIERRNSSAGDSNYDALVDRLR
jgi:hypothetical protein